MPKKIWSRTKGRMIPEGFTYRKHHYTWCEEDQVYWRDDMKDRYREKVPREAILDKLDA